MLKPLQVRVSVDISRDLHSRLSKLPYGMRSEIMRRLLEMVADAIEKRGAIMVGAIMSGDFELDYIFPKVVSQHGTTDEP